MKSPSSIAFFFLIPIALANENDNPYLNFQQQNKQQFQQFQQEQQQKWLKQHQYQTQHYAEQADNFSQQCLPYTHIEFVGFTLIDPHSVAPSKNECLNESRLNQLSRSITELYLKKGYIHNPFQFEESHSDSLIMRVRESKVTKLTNPSKTVNLAMVLPNMLGKPLNIWDLDQGLDQANKMQGSKVTVDVLPAENGEIELAFVNQQQSRIQGFIGIDNFASKQYQRWQTKLGLSIDSPLGLSDTLFLGASHSLKSFKQDFSRSINSYYSIPYGYWTFSNFTAFSQFHSNIPLQYQQAEQKGSSWLTNLRADYTFNRGSNHISTLYTALERSHNKIDFQHQRLTLQSPMLTTASLGITHLQLFENGSLSADLAYERGLKWGKALINQGRDQPEGQFNKWNIELQWQHFHPMDDKILHQTHRLSGQYSSNYLPANKQGDLVGRNAVRGFDQYASTGEKNIILQNSLGVINQYKQWQIEPYIAIDLGIQKATNESQNIKAIGGAFGVKFNHPHWTIQLEKAEGKVFRPHQAHITERNISLNVSWNW